MRYWNFRSDMNADGVVTISDFPAMFGWLFFYPGDLAILLTSNLAVTRKMLGIDASCYGGWLSGILSMLFWLILALWISFVVLEYQRQMEEEAFLKMLKSERRAELNGDKDQG